MNAPTVLKFSAGDTLFFREARPMEAQGVRPLGGRFPPPARTVAGALRSAMGEAVGVDWENWRKAPEGQRAEHAALDALIGPPNAQPPGPLQMTGPFPMLNGERLFPVPAHLLGKQTGENAEYAFLTVGDAVDCDLGRVYLPALPSQADGQGHLPGAKPFENAWLGATDFVRVLSGLPPEQPPLKTEGDLVASEPRLGIALEGPRRTAADGLLYQTVHARPVAESIAIGVGVQHRDKADLPNIAGQIVRFGGEGRHAGLEATAAACCPPLPSLANENSRQVLLTLLTAARFTASKDGVPAWLPPGFEASRDEQACLVWLGEIEGVALRLRAAALNKPVREGGWDLATHAPRPVESLLAAGSVFFMEIADADITTADAIKRLNGTHIGLDTALGRGEIAAGYWR